MLPLNQERKVIEMSFGDYNKALRMGERSYQEHLMHGTYPYLQVLEELLSHTDVVSEVPLGLVQIPIKLIVGTYAVGRRTAFAPNFMPLLNSSSEFAFKWSSLCDAHLKEGIRDPIKAYEFMNRFYVVEGNKRVSVLKYFAAVTIPGTVTRLVPKRTDEKENKIYYEFLSFYKITNVNYIWFSEEGGFTKLLQFISPDSSEPWTDLQKEDFRSCYYRFAKAFQENGGERLSITPADAMLVYLNIYGYKDMVQKLPSQMKEELQKIWDEIMLLTEDQSVELLMDPSEEPKKTFFGRLWPSSNKKLKVAFIHDKTAETSSWTYGHELGRYYLEETFGDQIETSYTDNVTPGDSADEAVEKAASEENDIIFTTTPQFMEASLKAAIGHPDVKILNCSLYCPHRYIRTYYARLHEAKFLAGIIAGSLAENGKIGYIADYPICGITAGINAFALGAQMINPRSRVYLEWSTVKSQNEIISDFRSKGISYISSQDLITPGLRNRRFGLSHYNGTDMDNIAMPIWHWGAFYKKLIESILNGSWESEDNMEEGTHAINYWWGMSADVIDIIYSQKLPTGLKRLVELVKSNIISSDFNPFSGILTSQTGIVHRDENTSITPEEIIHMDWLNNNVIGSFPSMEELSKEAQAIVLLQGVGVKDFNKDGLYL